MKKISQKISYLTSLSVIIALSACGGGGGGDTAPALTPSTTGTTGTPGTGTPSTTDTTGTGTTGAGTGTTGTGTTGAGTGTTGTGTTGTGTGTTGTGTTGTGTGTTGTTGTGTSDNSGTQIILPALTIDTESSTAVAQLGLGELDQQLTSSPNIDMELTRSNDQVEGGYSIKLKSGSFKQDKFYRDLILTPSTSQFIGKKFDIGGYEVNEYKSFSSTNSGNIVEGFGVILQTLAGSGFRNAGIANWKYVGDNQGGYFSGRLNAIGSFVFGSKTPAATVDSIKTSTYTGYAQSAEPPSVYINSQYQFPWTTVAEIDRVANTVKITAKTIPKYLSSFIYSDGVSTSIDLSDRSAIPQVSFTCTTPIVPGVNSFTCVLPSSSAQQGTIKGRFFGKNGEEIAGTFSIGLKGVDAFALNGTVIGAFIAKK